MTSIRKDSALSMLFGILIALVFIALILEERLPISPERRAANEQLRRSNAFLTEMKNTPPLDSESQKRWDAAEKRYRNKPHV